MDNIALEIENISIIKFPPYSPETNPEVGDANIIQPTDFFNRYDDVVDACSNARDSFIDDTKGVAQMSSRDWLQVGNT